jgi:hypothetical protein
VHNQIQAGEGTKWTLGKNMNSLCREEGKLKYSITLSSLHYFLGNKETCNENLEIGI